MTLTERIEELVRLSFQAGSMNAGLFWMRSGCEAAETEGVARAAIRLEEKAWEVSQKLKALLADLGQFS